MMEQLAAAETTTQKEIRLPSSGESEKKQESAKKQQVVPRVAEKIQKPRETKRHQKHYQKAKQ